MAKKRVTRHEVVRRGPIRNRAVQASTRFVRDIVDRRAEEAPRTPVGAVQGALEGTVATAYSVIERYMSRGHTAASLHYTSNGDSAMSDSQFPGGGPTRPPYNGGYGGGAPGAGFGSPGDPWGVNVWMEPWMQMMRVWTDGMNRFSAPASMTNPRASTMGTTANVGVSVEVQSTRPTTVALDLAPGVDAQHLTVGSLSQPGDSALTLEGVKLVSQFGRYAVQLKVADSQAPGVYVGPVEDAQRRTVGEVTVVVTGAAKARKRAPAKKRASSAAKKK